MSVVWKHIPIETCKQWWFRKNKTWTLFVFLVLFVCILLKNVPTFNHIWYSVYVDVHFLLAFRQKIGILKSHLFMIWPFFYIYNFKDDLGYEHNCTFNVETNLLKLLTNTVHGLNNQTFCIHFFFVHNHHFFTLSMRWIHMLSFYAMQTHVFTFCSW